MQMTTHDNNGHWHFSDGQSPYSHFLEGDDDYGHEPAKGLFCQNYSVSSLPVRWWEISFECPYCKLPRITVASPKMGVKTALQVPSEETAALTDFKGDARFLVRAVC